ncbi:MAG: DUF1631 domain-containing protein [Gammaproteobacteria bacterium]|nr:DUF1631 domain-containing protein [Gammaproteobacteria bacterium]
MIDSIKKSNVGNTPLMPDRISNDLYKEKIPTDLIDDPEYISKIINQFILDSDATNVAVEKQVATGKMYNREHIVDALTHMQLSYKPEYIPGQEINVNTDSFKSALMNSMAKLDNVSVPKTMNQIDGKTIEFTEMLFGAFLRDKNISHVIKTLLLSLQIPIIKTALLDKKFFYNKKHPARHVLDAIAHLGIGIEDQENTIYKTMSYIIDQLLKGFTNNLSIFNTAAVSLDRLTVIEKNKHEKTEKQTQELIMKEYARQYVFSELKRYTRNIEIPKPLQVLILTNWSSLMFNRFVRFGKESIEWRESVGVLRLLMKTIRPVSSKEEWLALRSIYKGIVSTVRSCLDETRQNKEKIFVAVSNLNNFYLKSLRNSEFSVENDEEEETVDVNILESLSDDDQLEISTDLSVSSRGEGMPANTIPDILEPGSWFEVFSDYSHPVRRLKLSVVLEDQSRLVFVDYMGNKVIEKDVDIFVMELKHDQSRLINDHSIFEYALSMVILTIAAQR